MHVCVRYQISIHEKQTKNSIPYALQPRTLLKTKLIKCVIRNKTLKPTICEAQVTGTHAG